MKTKIFETTQVKNKRFTRDSLKWCYRSGPWGLRTVNTFDWSDFE